jgi:hypothetical protein
MANEGLIEEVEEGLERKTTHLCTECHKLGDFIDGYRPELQKFLDAEAPQLIKMGLPQSKIDQLTQDLRNVDKGNKAVVKFAQEFLWMGIEYAQKQQAIAFPVFGVFETIANQFRRRAEAAGIDCTGVPDSFSYECITSDLKNDDMNDPKKLQAAFNRATGAFQRMSDSYLNLIEGMAHVPAEIRPIVAIARNTKDARLLEDAIEDIERKLYRRADRNDPNSALVIPECQINYVADELLCLRKRHLAILGDQILAYEPEKQQGFFQRMFARKKVRQKRDNIDRIIKSYAKNYGITWKLHMDKGYEFEEEPALLAKSMQILLRELSEETKDKSIKHDAEYMRRLFHRANLMFQVTEYLPKPESVKGRIEEVLSKVQDEMVARTRQYIRESRMDAANAEYRFLDELTNGYSLPKKEIDEVDQARFERFYRKYRPGFWKLVFGSRCKDAADLCRRLGAGHEMKYFCKLKADKFRAKYKEKRDVRYHQAANALDAVAFDLGYVIDKPEMLEQARAKFGGAV